MPGVMGDDALLDMALRHLMQAWAATDDGWRDQARADFGQQHLEPFEARVREAARVVKQMEVLITEMTRQCR